VLAIQLFPAWLWQTNPPVVREPAWDGPLTQRLARNACYDCHSNETVWPVYARIAPVSWLVTSDVVSGRRVLNFSEWGVAHAAAAGQRKGPEDVVKAVRDGEMPPEIYSSMHAAARLDEPSRADLIRGLRLSLR